MKISNSLILIFILISSSCSKNLNNTIKSKCYFDNGNLKVWNPDSKDTLINLKGYDYSSLFHYFEYGKYDYVKPKFINVDKKEIRFKKFSVLNIGCKDTLWAKNMLLSELKHRCPFEYYFKDTFCVQKYYNIKLVDSNLLVKSKYTNHEVSGNFGGGMDDWIDNFGVEYKDLIDHLVPNLIGLEVGTPCDRSTGYLLDSLPGLFDIRNYFTVYENFGEEAHIKVVRDSLGFELTKIKEEVVPYKIITYTKKEE